jgi:uncharacterized RDD family membrane protein YckC
MTARPGEPAEAALPLAPPLAVPSIKRRMAAFVYEGVVLFGVVFIAGYLFAALTQQRHALEKQTALQIFLFIVLGIYFVWFWSRGGQTVAMRAWHVRLLTASGQPVSQRRALVRYLLAYLWFLPALLAAWLAQLKGAQVWILLVVGVVAYALTALLHPRRQFWHDALCGTELVIWQPPRRSAS